MSYCNHPPNGAVPTNQRLRDIANEWETAFQCRTPVMLAGLHSLAADIVRTLHEDIEARRVYGRGSVAAVHILKQSIPAYADILNDAADTAGEVYTSIKRDYTRVLLGDGSAATKDLPREQRQMRREISDLVKGTELKFKRVLSMEPEIENSEGTEVASKETGAGVLHDYEALSVLGADVDDATLINANTDFITDDNTHIDTDIYEGQITDDELSAEDSEYSIDEVSGDTNGLTVDDDDGWRGNAQATDSSFIADKTWFELL